MALATVLAPLARAHADGVISTLEANERLKVRPTEVRLTFNEPVELRFSTLKVYPLHDPARLRTRTKALVGRVLRLKGDETPRADLGPTTPPRTTRAAVIGLKPGLKPGAYMVIWRVLSVDTHPSEGFFVLHLPALERVRHFGVAAVQDGVTTCLGLGRKRPEAGFSTRLF